MVETTAWDGKPPAPISINPSTEQKHKSITHWHDGSKTDYFPPDLTS